MRIVALLNRLKDAREFITLLKEEAQRLEAGVTLLYAKEERLLELPLFSEKEPTLEAVREHLLERLRDMGVEDWALLVYDGDPVDRLVLESEREHAALVATDLSTELRSGLIERSRTPILFVSPGSSLQCRRGLVVIDPAFSRPLCLSVVRRVLPAESWHAYMDDQILPTLGDGMVLDPVADSLAIEVGLEEELRSVHEKAFRELCESEGLEGSYEIGEAGVVEDILAKLSAEEAECLAVIAEDRDTLLGEALGELAERCPVNLLVCFQDEMRRE